MNMYFIALVAPEKINLRILKWKYIMQERFECNVALRSPAHITLIPPFWMNSSMEKELTESLEQFSNAQETFTVLLQNFSSFPPRVIFVAIEKNDILQKLQKNVEEFLLNQNKYSLKSQKRPFHPHISIATRDLHKKSYQEAWRIFENKKYKAQWNVTDISLLKHNKKNWDVIYTSQLNK